MTTVALVPARGGSRGLPGKNLARVSGRSLVARAVDVARAVAEIDLVVVSSDADEILDEGRRAGAVVERRPEALAASDTPSSAVVDHFLDRHPDVTVLVLLQPTSPLREAQDVHRCLTRLEDAPSVTTVTPLAHPAEWLLRGADDALEPLLGWDRVVPRRQDAAPTYSLNGAVYAAAAAHLRAGGRLVGPGTAFVIMPQERSVDVDDAVGLALARVLAERPPSSGGDPHAP